MGTYWFSIRNSALLAAGRLGAETTGCRLPLRYALHQKQSQCNLFCISSSDRVLFGCVRDQ